MSAAPFSLEPGLSGGNFSDISDKSSSEMSEVKGLKPRCNGSVSSCPGCDQQNQLINLFSAETLKSRLCDCRISLSIKPQRLLVSVQP